MYTAKATAVPTSPTPTLIKHYSQLHTGTFVAGIPGLKRFADVQMALNSRIADWMEFS